jgi:pimeloyl-ACP methyl ester carboxylesterase
VGRGAERFFAGRYVREVVPGAGHFLRIERPDAIAARIVGWFGEALG